MCRTVGMIERRMRIEICRERRIIRLSATAPGLLRTSTFHVISVLLKNFSLAIRQRSERLVNIFGTTMRPLSDKLALEFAL
jgi:hypothetical protein